MKPDSEKRFDPDRAYDALVKSGEDWADKNAAAELLEKTEKSVLAKLINEGGTGSVAARESVARAHPDFLTFVESSVEARRVANKARVRYDSAKTLAEMRRSEESTYRAEMALR